MRLQSESRVCVRDTIIGGADPLVCLLLVAKDKSDLLNQARELKSLGPDLFEWRIDSYDKVEDTVDSIEALSELRKEIADIPLIFTCRISGEGGFKKIPQDTRLTLIKAAIQSGDLDVADVEMSNETSFIEEVKGAVDRGGVKLIFSYHNFDETPAETFILDKLIQAQEMGADIAKVAVMPKGFHDILILMGATLKARTEALTIPMITMAMGSMGKVTRLAGGLLGSDITFAIGRNASAPGQIPIGVLRQAMAALYD
jgi:3-dehydroquinate dehydratase-1